MSLKAYTRSIPSMTTLLEITVLMPEGKDVSTSSATGKEAKQIIEQGFEEANRLIGIISAWQEGTELFEVNKQAGIKPVAVCEELFSLLQRSMKISALTDGLFDVTFASIDKIWFFDKPMSAMPDPEALKHSVRNIDYRFVELDTNARTVYIKNKGTKIELGAIGKGFIANKVKHKLISLGITSGIVNAGGDLTCWGTNAEGQAWKIGIADPHKKEKYIAWLPIHNLAVATSGSYERFALIDGQKYSHILHPKTGMPVKGLQSVTVINPDAELCDAVATSVFLMGREAGLEFVNRFSDIQCFVVDDEQRYFYSDNLKQQPYVQVPA